jgi:hypothetical protein
MIIDRRQELQEQQPVKTDESLKTKVPCIYYNRLGFFSKQQSDTLASHYNIDHKIELIQDNSLKSCHLNKHSVKKLETMYDYLFANLTKSFIVLNQALFASLVLFARKSNGSL